MEPLVRAIDPTDCGLIMLAAVGVALVSELIFYILIYRTEGYKKGVEEIQELKTKVYKLRDQAMTEQLARA